MKNGLRIRESVEVDKKNAYVICEWPHRQQWGKAISKWKQYWSWLYPNLRYEIFNIYLLYAVKAESF